LKRSNRLVLLVGVFLAIVAFVGILLLSQGDPTTTEQLPPTELPTVVATQDIPLGTAIRAEQVTEQLLPITGRDTDAFGSVTQVIGKIVRQPVATGAAITARTLSGGQQGQVLDIECPQTMRCISVQVDQVTGVGTVIKTGDYVDLIMALQADKFPVITADEDTNTFTVVAGLNSTSVKLVLQGMQVLGTLLPPPTTTTAPAPQASGAPPAQPGTALTGQQEIVILAVTPQQAEIIKFAQLDSPLFSLVLRSPKDFIDPETNLPFENGPIPDATTGVILKTLVDNYGVLPPELIEAILPAQP
jgi:Flp pilus assembly protein CpaB